MSDRKRSERPAGVSRECGATHDALKYNSGDRLDAPWLRYSRRLAFTALALLLFLPVAFPQAPPVRPIKIQSGVKVKMRDGVALVADIYRPRAEGKFPVLLERTPYDRRSGPEMAHELASEGFIVVVQDTRGRYDSEGEFYPFRHESDDGYDTVEWAAALDGSDGQVGMFGGSYVGATQMLAAMAKPPHLTAIFPYVTASEYYEGWTYQGGAWMQWFSSSWASILAIDTLRRQAAAGIHARRWIGALPTESYPLLQLSGSPAPYYTDWIRHERNDDYWKRWKISDHYHEMKVKGLHGGGWHDLFLKGSIGNYLGLRAGAATQEARDNQRLLLGPWAHAATSPEGKIGDVTFGRLAVLDMQQTALRWFNFTLKGEKNEYASGAPVRLFVMGENIWRNEAQFPPAGANLTRYFLNSSGRANGAAGDGLLSATSPTDGQPDHFTYNPSDPVPTIGGRLCCGAEIPPGPFDQRPNESRSDVLVFSTPPLEQGVEVTGFITAEIYAATSAPETDWTAMLVDVHPDGYARFLADGIVRARYRNSTEKAEPITPGKIYKYNVDLWATSNVFLPGHRIRLYVSSSNFPRFNRNLNTGEPTFGSTRFVKAEQTIYHDREHPSALILPILPR